MKISLPRLYPVIDRSCFSDLAALLAAAEQFLKAGVQILQYRNKSADPAAMLIEARALRQQLLGCKGTSEIRLIMNDRADFCRAADYDGVHVGQDDLSPEGARKVIGRHRWLGISTHNPQQVAGAEKTSADYIAIGPVFATGSKANPDPVIGLQGVRAARSLTRKPLVAIGGITRRNCRSVIEAGADSVAVISDLLPDPAKSAEEFLCILG